MQVTRLPWLKNAIHGHMLKAGLEPPPAETLLQELAGGQWLRAQHGEGYQQPRAAALFVYDMYYFVGCPFSATHSPFYVSVSVSSDFRMGGQYISQVVGAAFMVERAAGSRQQILVGPLGTHLMLVNAIPKLLCLDSFGDSRPTFMKYYKPCAITYMRPVARQSVCA